MITTNKLQLIPTGVKFDRAHRNEDNENKRRTENAVNGLDVKVKDNKNAVMDEVEVVRKQVDNVVVEAGGDANPELVQARTDEVGNVHPSLDSRLRQMKAGIEEEIFEAEEGQTVFTLQHEFMRGHNHTSVYVNTSDKTNKLLRGLTYSESSKKSISLQEPAKKGDLIVVKYYRPPLSLNEDLQTAMEQLHDEFSKTRTDIEGIVLSSLDERLKRLDYQRYYVNIKEFGAKGDGVTDDSQAFQKAISALKEGQTLYLPIGVFIVNLATALLIRDNISIKGCGWKTIIKIKNDRTLFQSANKATGRTRYFSISNLQIQAENNVTQSVLDFTGSSYFKIRNVLIVGNIDNLLNSDAIIFPKGVTEFNGYVELDHLFVHGFRNGVKGEGNDVIITGGFYNGNKEYGLHLKPANVLKISLIEASRNAKGGIYAEGNGIDIDNNWYEYNGWRVTGLYSPNNWEIGGKSQHVTIGRAQRHDYSSIGFIHGEQEDYGFNNGIGSGHNSSYGLCANGNFDLIDENGNPYGWRKVGDIQSLPIPDNSVPPGYGSGRSFQSFSTSGSPKEFQTILKADEVKRHKGNMITCHFYARVNESSPANLEFVRFGITSDPLTTAGMTNGAYVKGTQATIGEWLKYSLRYIVKGDESQINVGLQLYNNSNVDMTGFAVHFGELSFANHEKPITSAGGEIFGPLKINGRVLGYASGPPIEGDFKISDTYLNNNMAGGGNVGWSCISSGNPGLWRKWGTVSTT